MRYSYLILLFILFNCEEDIPERDNPLDDQSSDYVSPTVSLLTDLNNGDTLYAESLTTNWEGNDLVSEFRFKLDELDWTDWSEDASKILDYLDEGNHQLSAQSRYLNGDMSDIVSVSFVVDAVDGPSLMFLKGITKPN